jgi:NAD(P)-dependent dehydrogenase (short-subunit alcohol dehydrogenase family)
MSKKSILITGCSSGIGEACARGLKARGWRVLATARKAEDLKRLEGEGFEAFYLDYTEPDSIAATADAVLERTGGKLHALFNNGAYGQPGAIEDVPVEALRAVFEANLFGWHDLTRRVVPAMRANGGGRIVNCSSCLGLLSLSYRGAYNATKFALEGLTTALRQELDGSGIHVSLIEPGPIDTRFQEHALEAYRANIDLENSPHAKIYRKRIAKMEKGNPSRWKVGPEAVLPKLLHALESPRPKAHYFVTLPTWIMETARRLLPARWRDRAFIGQ